jgi:hypothetical protein
VLLGFSLAGFNANFAFEAMQGEIWVFVPLK